MSRVLQTEDDGEWADYDEPTEKDYSNLKIQTLTVKCVIQFAGLILFQSFHCVLSLSHRCRDREEEFREQKELEARLAREALEQQTGGPWVRKNLESVEPKDEIKASEDKAETAEKEAKSEEPITPAAPAKYIPPSQRMSMAAASSSTYAPPSRRNKAAPEIKNESEFPTLGGLKAK